MFTPAEIESLLVETLTAVVGGEAERWRKVIGGVRMPASATDPRCGWDVNPNGTRAEVASVSEAVALVHLDHPSWRR